MEIKSDSETQIELIDFYRKKIEFHRMFSIRALYAGIVIAILGLIFIAFFFKSSLSRGNYIHEKIDLKKADLKEVNLKISDLKKDIDLETNYGLYSGRTIEEFDKRLDKHMQEILSLNLRPKFIAFPIDDFSIQKKSIDNEVKIKSEILTPLYTQLEIELAQAWNNYRKVKKNDRWETQFQANEIDMLTQKRNLLLELQSIINEFKIDEHSDLGIKKIQFFVEEIESYCQKLKSYFQVDIQNKKTNKELFDKRSIFYLNEDAIRLEKELNELEQNLLALEKEDLRPGEIVAVSTELIFKFGVLVTIELIAFFLLKQYRLSLDESRYYNTFLRENENNLLMLSLLKDEKNNDLRDKIFNSISFQSSKNKLLPGESTEFLEIKKLSQDEMNVVAKALDIVTTLFKRKE